MIEALTFLFVVALAGVTLALVRAFVERFF